MRFLRGHLNLAEGNESRRMDAKAKQLRRFNRFLEFGRSELTARLYHGDKPTDTVEVMSGKEFWSRNKALRQQFINETNEHARMYSWKEET